MEQSESLSSSRFENYNEHLFFIFYKLYISTTVVYDKIIYYADTVLQPFVECNGYRFHKHTVQVRIFLLIIRNEKTKQIISSVLA